MTVWIVTKGWCPDTEPSTLETWDGFQEIIGVYASEADARFVAERLPLTPNQNEDICVTEVEVQ